MIIASESDWPHLFGNGLQHEKPSDIRVNIWNYILKEKWKPFRPSPQKYDQKQTHPIRDRQNGSAFITASTEQQQV